MRSFWPRALLALLAVVLVGEVLVIAPHPGVLVVLGAGGWMVLPGVVLARRAFKGRDAFSSSFAAWLIGPALGLGLSVFGVFLVWCAGLQNWLAILFGPALTWTVVALAGRFGGPTLRLPAFDRRDATALALVLFIVPLITWAPYDHVREPVADGEAYRAYFTADFIWAMTVTSELARGDVPPANPFLGDQRLHYYWMAHFLSGALYRNIGPWDVRAEQVILVDGLLFGLAFVAFFYGLARTAGGGPWTSALAVGAGFLANSYEGADMIRAIVAHGWPWSELTTVNIDAITRWFYKGMAVDGLQRLLLYQPHHLTGYMLALAALWLVALADDVTETAVALWAGILLGLAVLFSTFTAVIVGPALALVFGVRLLQQRALRSLWSAVVLGGAPLLVALALSTVLGYTDQRYGFLLQFGLNPVAAENVGNVLFLSFGPLLLGALPGLVRWRWVLNDGVAPVALIIVALAFYFLTNVPDSGDVWVGWRSGHLLLICFAVTGAAALTAVWRAKSFRPAIAVAVTAALLLAVPTVAVDVYNAQDVTNRGQGADFPWTLVITPAEREGLEWIRHSTPSDAVVQVDPYVRGSGQWAYIPAFAERRSIAGLPGSMIPLRPYREASDQLYWGVFRASSAAHAHTLAKFLGIDYLVLGRLERRAYPATAAGIASRADLFAPVFRNQEMAIFHVEPAPAH